MQTPVLSEIHSLPGIEHKDPLFLLSLLPCCAQLALPYMAKVMGEMRNSTAEDLMLRVIVTLFDATDHALREYSEVLALDAGEKGQFDVKLIELPHEVTKYSIDVVELDE